MTSEKFPEGSFAGKPLTFRLAPQRAPQRPTYALAFAFCGSRILLAQEERGLVIPSGKVEEGETALEAAIREAKEEADATLSGLQHFGTFRSGDTWSEAFLAVAEQGHSGKECHLENLPELYFAWDELMAAVFDAAFRIRTGPAGSY